MFKQFLITALLALTSTVSVGSSSMQGGRSKWPGSNNVKAFFFFLLCLFSTATFAQSSVNLTTTSNPYVGDTVTLTATVVGNNPTGTVTFYSGEATILGTAPLNGGVATLSTVFTTSGSKTITAVYSGDANNGSTTSPQVKLSVWKKPTTTAITIDASVLNVGQPLTVTATVTGDNPTGQVSFWFDPYTTVFATLVNGSATVTAPAIATGATGMRYVQATYRADAANAGSDSSRAYYTVQGTSVKAAPSNPYVGDTVTLTATVGGNNPTGTVTFYNGETLLGTAPLSGSAATLSTVFDSGGSKTITAVYSGDANNGSTTSPAVALSVRKKSTTTNVTVSPTTVQVGEPLTVTATVTGDNPTGSVIFNFQIGNKWYGTSASLVNGQATITAPSYATATVGTQSVLATFSADAVNAGSQSSAVHYTVSAQNENVLPTVSLVAPSDNASFVAPANIDITASANDSDGTVNKVEFFNGSALLATVTAAPYEYAWANVPPGTYSITAVATDDKGETATSSVATITVTANALPTISLSSPTNNASFTAPASITLTADASDSDGSISQVAFYQGDVFIGSTTSAPYTLSWPDVPAGSYAVTAVATDNLGSSTTSAPVAVTVAASGAAAQIYYIHPDHLNTPRLVTDTNNNVVWQWDNDDPFGKNVPQANQEVEFNLRFPGQYFDKETNLHYNYYRDYDPQAGRYIQSDPIGLDGGINTFAYVHGNPISNVDPDGRIVLNVAGGIYGAIAGGVGGYISSGGRWQGAAQGALLGGGLGLLNPIGGLLGTFIGGFGSSVVGQVAGNYGTCGKELFDINGDLAALSAVAGLGGNVFGRYLANPRRSAFTYAVAQRMGTSQVLNNTGTAVMEGVASGSAEYLGFSPSATNECICK